MNKITELVKKLPPMLSGKELISSLAVLPEYNPNDIKNMSVSERLIAISNLYSIYIPSKMSLEIYNKLSLALIRSMQKKTSEIAMKQRRENYKAIQQKPFYGGIIGGSDSFSIIGCSGIGKTTAINRAIDLLTVNPVIETKDPYTRIIPCLVIQCPFDSSIKGMLLEILRKVDELLDSNYYKNAFRKNSTTDMLIGVVSQVALNNIGVLIIDEIQNVCNSKNGNNLIGSLTQLINNSGISICLVGTPECTKFFEQTMYLARRSLGLQYGLFEYGTEFIQFCNIVFHYQYTIYHTEISDTIVQWLYEHSNGNISIVVSLLHDAQEIAILSRKEELNIEVLTEAYKQRMFMLHGYIEPLQKMSKTNSSMKSKSNINKPRKNKKNQIEDPWSIRELANEAKEKDLDIVSLLKEKIEIIEVSV